MENEREGGIKDDCQVTGWMVVQRETMFPHNTIVNDNAQIQSTHSIVLITIGAREKPTPVSMCGFS